MATIDDLLRALQNPNEGNAKLRNDFTTWQRIGNKDEYIILIEKYKQTTACYVDIENVDSVIIALAYF